jgi:hypothetical protein
VQRRGSYDLSLGGRICTVTLWQHGSLCMYFGGAHPMWMHQRGVLSEFLFFFRERRKVVCSARLLRCFSCAVLVPVEVSHAPLAGWTGAWFHMREKDHHLVQPFEAEWEIIITLTHRSRIEPGVTHGDKSAFFVFFFILFFFVARSLSRPFFCQRFPIGLRKINQKGRYCPFSACLQYRLMLHASPHSKERQGSQ